MIWEENFLRNFPKYAVVCTSDLNSERALKYQGYYKYIILSKLLFLESFKPWKDRKKHPV